MSMTDMPDRSVIAERKGLPVGVLRMRGLEIAAELLGGQKALADLLSIDPRGLRYKITGERGVSDPELSATAAALEGRADRMLKLAAKLREQAAA